MKAKCRTIDPMSLGLPAEGIYYTDRTIFHLQVGSEYEVMGIGAFKASLVVLVRDETGYPNWLPIGLFDFRVQALPSTWGFRLIDRVAASSGHRSEGWVAIWGYWRLVTDERHLHALVDRDPVALAIFDRELSSAKG
jgi:hypothetical protein